MTAFLVLGIGAGTGPSGIAATLWHQGPGARAVLLPPLCSGPWRRLCEGAHSAASGPLPGQGRCRAGDAPCVFPGPVLATGSPRSTLVFQARGCWVKAARSARRVTQVLVALWGWLRNLLLSCFQSPSSVLVGGWMRRLWLLPCLRSREASLGGRRHVAPSIFSLRPPLWLRQARQSSGGLSKVIWDFFKWWPLKCHY